MNYIYDIVLNFNKEYYNFFEWNKRDNIVNVKKIPLFLVNNDTFKMFKYDNVTVGSDFINLIKDKTYTYSRIKIGNTSLITNGKEVIAVLFNDKGELIKRSSLLLDEEEEVLNETSNDSIYNIDIVKSSRNKISFVNRSQKEKKNFLIKYINKENNLTNLKYLYYDYFEKEDAEHRSLIEWMVPGAQKDMMEPVRLTLKPGGTSDIYLPHEGEEFGYVLKGSIKIIYGTRTYTARQGESFYLKSNKKHHIENTGRKDAVLIWVTNPPSF